MNFKEIIEKQVATGFSATTLDVEEYSAILSISHRHFDGFTNSNGQQIPAGYSYRLNTKSGLLKVSTNEENFNNAVGMFKNCKPENYVKYCIIEVSEGTNRTTNEKFVVVRFTCNYCAEEEDAE